MSDRQDVPEPLPEPPSGRRLFNAALIALATALVLLFTVVLPVEYQVDPLGTGRLLGLDALANAGENPLQLQLEPAHRSETVEFYLEPFQSVEYKYQMDLDATLVFTWEADGALYYDMHAEPAGLGVEAVRSFSQGTADRQSGSYRAPFAGIHGWFWENRGRRDVVIRLYSAGHVGTGTVFSTSGNLQREPPQVGR